MSTKAEYREAARLWNLERSDEAEKTLRKAADELFGGTARYDRLERRLDAGQQVPLDPDELRQPS